MTTCFIRSLYPLMGCVWLLLMTVAQAEALLKPEKAFALAARIAGEQLVVTFKIADGYYLYREQLGFQVLTDQVTFGPPILPEGQFKQDAFLGDAAVYRNAVAITLPLMYTASKPRTLQVQVNSQGCADIGVCYPPQQQHLTINTAASVTVYPIASDFGSNKEGNRVALLQTLLGKASSQVSTLPERSVTTSKRTFSSLRPLEAESGLADGSDIPTPDLAFVLTAKLLEEHLLQSQVVMHPDTYLYRDKIKINLVSGTGHRLLPITLPRGDPKSDAFLGETEVFHKQLTVPIGVISDSEASPSYILSYQYQGCVEDRICYPPITRYIAVDTEREAVHVRDQIVKASSGTGVKNASPPTQIITPQAEQDVFADLLSHQSTLVVIGLFFIAGLGLAFTPCVLPMIPILSSIIVGEESMTTRKAFLFSLVYVLVMAITYAFFGAIAGYYGAAYNIQIWFQNPLILSLFAGLFVFLALAMFGLYDLQVPAFIQTRLTVLSNQQSGGTLIGVGLMGFFSAAIVGPCITAPLVGALLFISQTQNWQLGGFALFALGIGMGTPLLLIGTSAGKFLQRATAWFDAVKAVFGVALLGTAIWLLERVLPVSITMGLIAILSITSAVYMGALVGLAETASGWHKLKKAVAIILFLYGAAYLIGATTGSQNILQPLRGVVAGTTGAETKRIQFASIKGEQGLQQALVQSVRNQRETMLDFYADWCISCKKMERDAFTNKDVLMALGGVVTLQTDVTANDAIDVQFMDTLGIYGPPAILFFDTQGQEIRHRRIVGEVSGEEFAAHINATF